MNKEELNQFFSQKFEYVARYTKEQTFVKSVKKSEICEMLTKKLGTEVKLVGPDSMISANQKQNLVNTVLVWNIDVSVEGNVFKVKLYIKPLPLKGKAKALGLKSTFVKENEVILTSPEKGNDSRIEIKVRDNDINKVVQNDPTSFNIDSINNAKVVLKKRDNKATIDNPTNVKRENEKGINYHLDYLEKKDDLEKTFFGKTFDDNIHIQLIYNVLDIKKILSLYVDDIVFVLYNLGRSNDYDELMGQVKYTVNIDHLNDKYEKLYNNYFDRAKSYLLYFGNAYSQTTNEDLFKIEIHKILRTLSLCRQFVRHSDEKQISLYELDNYKNDAEIKDLIDLIEDCYQRAWDKLNSGFVKNAQKNIYLIREILELSDNETEDILNEYYQMFVGKSNANRGFNFTKLKEKVVEKLELGLSPEDKGGYHQIINFIINHQISDALADKYVGILRSCETEAQKEGIYNKFASELYPKVCDYLNEDNMAFIKEVKTNRDKYREKEFMVCDNSMLKTSMSDTMFDKLIFFVTLFLSPKDSNMLLTSLINKLSNINTFNHLIKELYGTQDIGLEKEFVLFNNSLDYVKKLTTVMSLTRIQKQFNKQSKKEKTAKKSKNEKTISQSPLFYDVYNLFGFNNCDMGMTIKELNKKIYETHDGKYGKKYKSLRNFIVSNFINSNKFRYIVEYANPEDCYKIVQNKKIVINVLKDIPDSQLKKYAEKVGYEYSNRNEVSNKLAKDIASINIKMIYEDYDKNQERITMLSGLYLAVVYIVVKQLVRVNSYYSIAFSCLERDRSLYGFEGKDAEQVDLNLVETFIEKNKFKNKTANYLKENMKEYNELFSLMNNITTRFYRDKVVHVNIAKGIDKYIMEFLKDTNVPMHSYFELYTYLMQKMLIEDFSKFIKGKNELFDNCKWALENRKTYDRNFLHVINMPFAYNLARYKNLTIEDIFYDNYKDKLKVKEVK